MSIIVLVDSNHENKGKKVAKMKIAGEKMVYVGLPVSAAKAAVLMMRERVKELLTRGYDDDASDLLEHICLVKDDILQTEEDEEDE